MPRTKLPPAERLRRHPRSLVGLLAEELKSPKASGQPVVSEEHYKTGLIRVIVLWDRWKGWPHEDRTLSILSSYREAEGDEFADRISLATGLTFPEAISSGMLPFQIIPALRKGDPVTADQCVQAMIDEGASVLVYAENPQLRFPSEVDAKEALKRLSERLPQSEEVWQIVRNVGQGLALLDDMAE
jgi:hypothetical protein